MPEGSADYRDAMPTGRSARAGVVALALLLAGCAGGVAVTPSTTPSTTASAAAAPPLADDLTGGTPVQLGSAGHWAISAGRAFTIPDDGTVTALDLASGRTLWRAGFTTGKAWDARPQLGLSTNQSTLIAVRTVDTDAGARLNLLLLDAATGTVLAEHLISDPGRKWSVDLPPKVLAADADTLVLADDPESGRQTAVVRVSDGRLLWRVDEQAVAASAGTVVTRSGGRARGDGKQRWQAAAPLGPLLAQTSDVIVVGMASSAVWFDPSRPGDRPDRRSGRGGATLRRHLRRTGLPERRGRRLRARQRHPTVGVVGAGPIDRDRQRLGLPLASRRTRRRPGRPHRPRPDRRCGAAVHPLRERHGNPGQRQER